MKKVARILGAILLALLFGLCVYIMIDEIDFWTNYFNGGDIYSPFMDDEELIKTSIKMDIVVILVGTLSAIGLKKLVLPKKTIELDEETAAEAKKRRTKRAKILALVMCAIVGIVVIAVLVRPCLIGKHNYDYDNVVVTKEATCSVRGEKIVTCTVCKKASVTLEIPIDWSAHDWSDYEVVQEASGCVPGEQVRTCKACGKQESEEIQPPLEHEYGEWEYQGRTDTEFRYVSICRNCGTKGYQFEDRHKVKCINCNGTGVAKFYYGSSDLEAILSGHDPYTYGDCPLCRGTGKTYADYPWDK